jgi:hypothetical protein
MAFLTPSPSFEDITMPVTQAQFASGANRQLEVYAKGSPVDQVNTDRPFLRWLIANKKDAPGGNQYFNEKVRISNDSNYQNYSGDDQVTYNRRDTVRLAKFPWSNFHDGFGVNEDEMAANGITLTDDVNAQVTDAERIQIYNLMTENYEVLKEGVQEKFNEEMLLSGSQDPKAAQGLDALVSTTPTVGVIGGIDAATAVYWRNNVNLNIPTGTAGVLQDEMEETWRACTKFGKMRPDKILAGSAFIDAYRKDLNATNARQINVSLEGSEPKIDGGTGDLYFKKVLVEWDPTFDTLDTLYGPFTIPWTKRCYFLNSKTIKLRPLTGHWMVNRKPPRMYDRYVHYFAMTSKYRLTINKRNANAVLSIA